MSLLQNTECPVCDSKDTSLFRVIDVYNYYECGSCRLIFISPDILKKIDQGDWLINYNNNYWREELPSARERSWGAALARVAEVFLYARLPIRKFIDIGSGPGYFLDAINHQLPSSKEVFHAVELFPPPEEFCTTNKNYHRGKLSDLDFEFDAGCCIEVIEHLTPSMFKGLLSDLAAKSKENSIYIFNTGLVEYIKFEDIDYLDPLVRGHIIGWSIDALRLIAEPLGFEIIPIPGKAWAFIAEFLPKPISKQEGTSKPEPLPEQEIISDRILTALPENLQTLNDSQTGDLMYISGFETIRIGKLLTEISKKDDDIARKDQELSKNNNEFALKLKLKVYALTPTPLWKVMKKLADKF